MSRVCLSHVTQVQISHVTCVNESCHTCTNKSCHVCAWVMSHVWTVHITHLWMRRATPMDALCHMYEWFLSSVWLSHTTWTSHVHTFMNMSRHTYGCVVSHVYIDWFWLLGQLIHNRAICARIVIMNFELDWDCSVMVSKVPGKKHKKLFNVTNISSITEDRQAKLV